MKNENTDKKLFVSAIGVSILLIADIIVSSINLYHDSKKLKILERCNKLQSELKDIIVHTDEEAKAKIAAEAKSETKVDEVETREESN